MRVHSTSDLKRSQNLQSAIVTAVALQLPAGLLDSSYSASAAPVFENHVILTMKPGLQLLDLVDAHNTGAVYSQKLFRIELRLEAADRFAQQISFSSVVNPDVIAFRFDTVNVVNVEEENPAFGLDYQSFQVSRASLQFLEQRQDVLISTIAPTVLNQTLGALPGHFKPLLIKGFQEIVKRMYFKSAHCVLIVGSGKNYVRRFFSLE